MASSIIYQIKAAYLSYVSSAKSSISEVFGPYGSFDVAIEYD